MLKDSEILKILEGCKERTIDRINDGVDIANYSDLDSAALSDVVGWDLYNNLVAGKDVDKGMNGYLI